MNMILVTTSYLFFLLYCTVQCSMGHLFGLGLVLLRLASTVRSMKLGWRIYSLEQGFVLALNFGAGDERPDGIMRTRAILCSGGLNEVESTGTE